jgi:hypothetical protein
MTSFARRSRILCALVLVGAVTGQAEAQSSPAIVTLSGTVSLADLVTACRQSASGNRPGAVVIRGKLRDAHVDATLDVPCAVQLDGRTGVDLADCRLRTRTLNVSDSAHAAGNTTVRLKNVTLTGEGAAGLFVLLTDPRDKIDVVDSALDYARGIVLQAPGSRIGADEGGKVRVKRSTLTAADADGDGVIIGAATSRGNVLVSHSTLTEPAIVLADRCRIVGDGLRLDCGAPRRSAH